MAEPSDVRPENPAGVPAPAPSPELPPDLEGILQNMQDIGTLVDQQYGPLKFTVDVGEGSFHVGLAPQFGKLEFRSLKMMDMALQVAIIATLRTLARYDLRAISWDEALSTMLQNPALEPAKHGVFRRKVLVRPPKRRLRSHSPLHPQVLAEIETWFADLVQDEGVLMDTKINTEVLSRILVETDVTIDSLKALLRKSERKSRVFFDIGVLRFPNKKEPYIKLYRIQLTAWIERKQYLGLVWKEDGALDGTYSAYDFYPCKDVLDVVQPQVQEQAAAEVEQLFETPYHHVKASKTPL
ncbi:hypothetical protein PsYK624_047940 [Phanerochaete sordida]|uniref:Uncharacterized protein n=1 Tax=Phanerochaete sordida TaxID=48140 RepID=A0A9P3G5P6_9APHY|nr:hypothetical protein PsYK624_047940 [Phanerochaete sordida]